MRLLCNPSGAAKDPDVLFRQGQIGRRKGSEGLPVDLRRGVLAGVLSHTGVALSASLEDRYIATRDAAIKKFSPLYDAIADQGLVERNADPALVALHRMALTDHVILRDHQHEGGRHADRTRELQRCAGLGDIADRAIKPDAVEGDGGAFQHPVPRCSASLNHVTIRKPV
jgi:hypothetical protein